MAVHSLICGSVPLEPSPPTPPFSAEEAFRPVALPQSCQDRHSSLARLGFSAAIALVALLCCFVNFEWRMVILLCFGTFGISYLLLTFYREANWARRSFFAAFSALALNGLRGFEVHIGSWRVTFPSDPWPAIGLVVICAGLLIYDFRMRGSASK